MSAVRNVRFGAAILALALSACGSSTAPFAVKCDGLSKERSLYSATATVRRVSETFVIDPATKTVLVLSPDRREMHPFCEKPAVCDTRVSGAMVAVDGRLKSVAADGTPVRIETEFRLMRESGSGYVDRRMTAPHDWSAAPRPMTCLSVPIPEAAGTKA